MPVSILEWGALFGIYGTVGVASAALIFILAGLGFAFEWVMREITPIWFLGGHVALGFYTVQQALVSSSLAGNRAGLTLFGMAVAGHFGYIDFPPGIQFLTTLPGIAGLFGLSVIEELTERDEDMQDILQYVNYGTKGMAGALGRVCVDMMPDGTPAWLATPLGFMLAGATHYYRMKLHESLRGLGDHWLSPCTYLVALETGGVLALLLALIFAPIIALVLIVAPDHHGGVVSHKSMDL